MKMKTVPALDFPLSAVGFGCWAAGGDIVWTGSNDHEMIRTIQRGMALGINFFDVAPVYGFGHAERVLGRALAGRRHDVIIASKCGLRWDDAGNIVNDLRPERIQQEIAESLQRLNTDYIDIYQMHWPDPQTPIADSMNTLLKLQAAGKIRHIGVSNFSNALTDEARQYGPIVSQQGLYSILERNPSQYHSIPLEYRTEAETLPYCRAHGMAFFPYSPLFQGLLTDHFKAQGQFDAQDVRASNPKLNPPLFQTYYAIRAELLAFSAQIGRPLSQVAINWLIEQPEVTSVICGAQSISQIEENAASTSWTLTADMLEEIERILRPYHEIICA
jgi:aryl-alcohol dehydrogenase-like predicted oxidoreductase